MSKLIRRTITISLPRKMARQVEQFRRVENRTRSELIREALRVYFSGRFPVVTPTKAELRAIRRGREEYKRGEYVTLDQLLHALGNPRRSARTKRA
jgi:CopG family transcriptional regulator/antitoxin EndoAI